MDELERKLRGAVEPLLASGEVLRGACVASQVGLFKGRMVVVATTDRRLVVQGLTGRFEPDGEPVSIPPERLGDASAEGAGGGWPELGAAIMEHAAVTLKLRTTDGERLKLTLMRGTGPLGSWAAANTSASGSRHWLGSSQKPSRIRGKREASRSRTQMSGEASVHATYVSEPLIRGRRYAPPIARL